MEMELSRTRIAVAHKKR